MRSKRILVIGLTSTFLLAACATNQKLPTKPTKPTLDVEPRDGGGMCLDKSSSTALGIYIQELEKGYDF